MAAELSVLNTAGVPPTHPSRAVPHYPPLCKSPHRLSGADTPPGSPTHLLSFTALIRLMHSTRGREHVAAQLPLLVEVAMRALDPGKPALRRCGGWGLSVS